MADTTAQGSSSAQAPVDKGKGKATEPETMETEEDSSSEEELDEVSQTQIHTLELLELTFRLRRHQLVSSHHTRASRRAQVY